MNSQQDIKHDLDLLFNLLISNSDGNQSNQEEEIDKSTLMSLLMYLDLHKSETEFFSYIKRTLENSNQMNGKNTLTRQEFINLFLEPEIKFNNLKNDEMASIFKIFDHHQKGSFSADDFLYYYKASPQFLSMKKEEQEELIEKIKNDFKIVSESEEITPIEFFKIINMQNQ